MSTLVPKHMTALFRSSDTPGAVELRRDSVKAATIEVMPFATVG